VFLNHQKTKFRELAVSILMKRIIEADFPQAVGKKRSITARDGETKIRSGL
jgi:hypothetical protein